MFGAFIVFLILWFIFFLFFAPSWLFLLMFLPVGLEELKDIPTEYHTWFVLFIIPVSVIDIQTLQADVKYKGAWRYIAWLPVAIIITLIAYNFSWRSFHFTFDNIWALIFGTFLLVLFGKMWISNPLMLFINRLSIVSSDEVVCNLQELKAQRGGRSISYYLIASNMEKMEISGLVYFYLKAKKLNPGDKINFRVKTGLTGVTYASGFPRVGERAKS